MNVRLKPSLLTGNIAAIPSKSDAHRLLICAAFAKGQTRLHLTGSSRDIDATARCLRALGAEINSVSEGFAVHGITVPARNTELPCGESGSTLRFLLPVAAAIGADAVFVGEGRLPQRPIDGLLEALSGHGVTFSTARLPLSVSGKLEAGVYFVPGNVSSQYITGLLLALPLIGGDSKIVLTSPLVSKAYVDMTISAMERFGVCVNATEGGYSVSGGQGYLSPGEVHVEGDWSNAAFFLAAGALGGGVTVTGLGECSSQPDRRIVSLLRMFGAEVTEYQGEVTVRPGELHGCTIDVDESPDLFPILAVMGAFADGETRLINAGRLRIKESDRICTTAEMLRNLGVSVTEGEDFLVVRCSEVHGGEISSAGDHRIAMAGAVAAAFASGDVVISGAEACEKSYPAFFEDYARLGGAVRRN